MKLSFFLALGGLAASINAAPAPSTHTVHEKRDVLGSSSQWQRRDVKLDRRTTMPMSIALAQRNLENGPDFLLDVSNPKSMNYGAHWSSKQIAEMFSASNETITSVTSWLISEGISEERITLSKGRNWVKFEATVEEVEYILKTEYKVYESTDGKSRRSLATDEYSVPLAVRSHVDFITPTVQFDAIIPKRSPMKRDVPQIEKAVHHMAPIPGFKSGSVGPYPTNSSSGPNDTALFLATDLKGCDKQVTTECLRALYKMPNGTLAKSSLTIVEYTPQSFIPKDLEIFLAAVDPWIPSKTQPKVDFVDGAKLVQGTNDNIESNLDLQLAIPLVYPQEVTYVQVGDTLESGSFNTFLDAVDGSYCTSDGGDNKEFDPIYPDTKAGGFKGHDCGTLKPGSVISTSYGSNEAAFSRAYLTRQCNEYMKLGLQGVSVLWASGDCGASGLGRKCCAKANCEGGLLQDGTKGGYFNPDWAGTCPYVTAVGGTVIEPGKTVRDRESAASFSGGGFSNIFDRPAYQKDAVSKYLSKAKLPFKSSLFNDKGRAYPDISANGQNIVTVVDGAFQSVAGTSASTPIVASLFTLINNKLIEAGKPVIGFANPVLYAHPEAMNDIVSGNAPACNTDGFAAVSGWDPITGLGTPDYVKLLDVFMKLHSY